MPSRSAWDSLTNAASEKLGDVADKAKSFYGSTLTARRRRCSRTQGGLSLQGCRHDLTVRRPTTETPVGTDTATKRSERGECRQHEISGAPSQIDKAIASMDH